MKARMLLLTLALCFAGTALSFAQSPQMGTWKLDEAKSKTPAGLVEELDRDLRSRRRQHQSDHRWHRRRWQAVAHRVDRQVRRQRLSAHRRPHRRFAVVQNDRRTHVGANQQERRQSDYQRQSGSLEGRQDPHSAPDRHRSVRQEGLRRLDVQQAVGTPHLSAAAHRYCRGREGILAVHRPPLLTLQKLSATLPQDLQPRSICRQMAGRPSRALSSPRRAGFCEDSWAHSITMSRINGMNLPGTVATERLPWAVRALLGCGTACLAVALTYAFTPLRAFPLLLAFPTVILSAWFLGMWGGVFCSLTEAVLVNYFLTRTELRFSLGNVPQGLRLAVFLLLSIFLAWIIRRSAKHPRAALYPAVAATGEPGRH